MNNPPPPSTPQQAADALTARLLVLADSPDEAAAKAELGEWAEKIGPFAALRNSGRPVRSIAAAMLWTLGRDQEALGLAASSIRLHGPDELCQEIIDKSRRLSIREAHDAIEAKRPDMARARLRGTIAQIDGAVDQIEERAVLELLARVDQIAAAPYALPAPAIEGRPTVITIGMWGDRFIEGAAKSVLACCLAPGNVPALSRIGTVILHIHTRADDVERVRALDIVIELSRFARIEIEALPEALFIPSHMAGLAFWNRIILAMAGYHSLMFARALGADMICVSGDLLLADGCLKAAKKKLIDGFEIVLCTALRSRSEVMLAAMDRYRTGLAIEVPGDALYRLSLEAFHPALMRHFMRQEVQHTVSDPYQFFFTAPGGFHAHAFHWHPLAISTLSVSRNIGFDSHTIDARFPSDLLMGKDRNSACYLQRSPPDDFYLVSLDSGSGIEAFGNFGMTPVGVAHSMTKWVERAEDIAHFDWLIRQRSLYRVPADLGIALPDDCLDEDGAIHAIADEFEAIRRGRLAWLAQFD